MALCFHVVRLDTLEGRLGRFDCCPEDDEEKDVCKDASEAEEEEDEDEVDEDF